MAKGSGGTRSGSSSNPRGVAPGFGSLGDYYRPGASDELARRMTTPSAIESEMNKYTDMVGRTLGVDTSRGMWSFNDNVYRSVFGSNFSYANERLQSEGFDNAVRKAVLNMSERDRAALVLANSSLRSVQSINLNQKDGSTRTPLGPYQDDVATSSLLQANRAERTRTFDRWKKNIKEITYNLGSYERKP